MEFLSDLMPTPGENLIGKVKILIAQLVGGQRGELSPTAALRGEAKGPLIFEAEDIVITLDIQPAPNEFVFLLGQVAAVDQDAWTGATVKLQQADLPDLTVSLDDLGAFHFEEVRPSPIQITVMSTQEIVVQTPKIDIGV